MYALIPVETSAQEVVRWSNALTCGIMHSTAGSVYGFLSFLVCWTLLYPQAAETVGKWPRGLLSASVALIPKSAGDATLTGQQPSASGFAQTWAILWSGRSEGGFWVLSSALV